MIDEYGREIPTEGPAGAAITAAIARQNAGQPPGPGLPQSRELMDIWQRYMYPQAEISPTTPTLSQSIAQGLVGDRPSPERRQFVGGLMGTTGLPGSEQPGLVDVTPAGTLLAAHEAGQQIGGMLNNATRPSAGDVAGLGMTLAGAIPAIAPEAREVRAATIAAAAADAAKGGRREAITAGANLRDMPLNQAIDAAKTERHIIPSTAGGYVGAPSWVKTPEDLQRMREGFDKDVTAGAGGADWYERAQNWIKTVAGDDPARQSELARNLGLMSAQAEPAGNLGFSIQARNAAVMGTPADLVHTGQQAETYNKAFASGEPIPLGPKTDIYARHLDPTAENPSTGTNDIWHARAFGYTDPDGTPWSQGLSPQQHAFMDAETVLAVDRANQKKLGGRSDWTPGEVQAAPWVAGKARGLESGASNRGATDPATALVEAGKTYPDYAQRFTAYGTHEAIPGRATGHLPDIAGGPEDVRQAYAADPASNWQGPGGRDIIHAAQGGYVQPTRQGVGVYGGDTNPVEVATPLVSQAGPSRYREIAQPSRQMMTGGEALRSYLDAQEAGAWSHPIAKSAVGHQTGYQLTLPASMQNPSGIQKLQEIGKNYGLPDIVHYGGERGIMSQFDPDAARPDVFGAKGKALQRELGQQGVTAEPVHISSGYIGHDWGKGVGSDTVTKAMLENLNPAQRASLSSPEVKAKAQALHDRDAELAAQGHTVRPDVQTARRIFAADGVDGLIKNIGKGLLPAGAAAALLTELHGQPASQSQTPRT